MSDATRIQVRCTINGKASSFETYPMARLIDVLREQAHLTGTKEGCGEGECGACAVLIDGELVNSCLVPAIQISGADILTIEGVAGDPSLEKFIRTFVETGGVQCGICTPGMVMAIAYLLRQKTRPSTDEVRVAISGNLCRCTGYAKIVDSVARALERRATPREESQ